MRGVECRRAVMAERMLLPSRTSIIIETVGRCRRQSGESAGSPRAPRRKHTQSFERGAASEEGGKREEEHGTS